MPKELLDELLEKEDREIRRRLKERDVDLKKLLENSISLQSVTNQELEEKDAEIAALKEHNKKLEIAALDATNREFKKVNELKEEITPLQGAIKDLNKCIDVERDKIVQLKKEWKQSAEDNLHAHEEIAKLKMLVAGGHVVVNKLWDVEMKLGKVWELYKIFLRTGAMANFKHDMDEVFNENVVDKEKICDDCGKLKWKCGCGYL